MSDPISTLLNGHDPLVAIVGATDNPHKYGSVIYRDLKAKGYRVVPVNPHRATVAGDDAFPTLAALPAAPDVVNFVVPPDQTLAVLREAKELGYTTVWVQPGASSPAVEDYLVEGGFAYLANACIMVQAPVRA